MDKTGSIKDLRLQTEKLDAPGADEVCVKVHAVGLNFADVFAIQGLYKAAPKHDFIPGLEFSGEVIEVGSAVTEWKQGDRVMGATKFGGYVSHININRRYVLPLPAQWSFEEGAGFLVQGLTAYYALKELGGLKEGMTVLVHSAAGGVGLLANRICKKYNCHTIGTVGSPGKVDFLRQHESYDDVIVRDDDFYDRLVKALAGRPLNLVMECIGGKILMDSWKAMAPMGRLIAFGSASFATHGNKPQWLKLLWRYLKRPKIDPLRLPTQNKSLMGFNLIYLPNPGAVSLGLPNLEKHIENILKYGVTPVVAINSFPDDSIEEVEMVKQSCEALGVTAITSTAFADGGEGSLELAEEVIKIIGQQRNEFKPLYNWNTSTEEKILKIATEMYGAKSVEYTTKAKQGLKQIRHFGFDHLPVCMAKTPKSLSDDEKKLGRPRDFVITVRDFEFATGAGFIVPILGDIMRMPGLPAVPAAEQVDIDENGKIVGLF